MASVPAKKDSKALRIPMLRRPTGEGTSEDEWQPLRKAIKDIQENGFNGRRFDELYLKAYAMVVHEQGSLLYGGLREAVSEHLVNNVRPGVLTAAHDTFLQAINRAWNEHQAKMSIIGDIVMYLDRMYVPKNQVYNVYNLGVVLFRDEVVHYGDIKDKLRDALFHMINRERNGEKVDRILIKDTCLMLGKLGVDYSVYERDFERPFLAQTAEFYALESQKHLAERTAIDYIDMAEQRINEESELARDCLDASTERLISQVVYEELVAKHVKKIVEMEGSGVVHMLENQKVEDLARTFRLLSRAEDGLETIVDCANKYVRKKGRSIMMKEGCEADSLCIVKKLLDLKDNLDQLLHSSFNDDSLVKEMINANFEYIVNLTCKSPEHLALFIDGMLSKGIKGMTQRDTDELLDKTIAVFRFLQDKELFEPYHREHLCKRLLLNKSVSEDAEKSIVSKLKAQCGSGFTSKLEVMLKDIYLSKTMTAQFKTTVASCDIDLHGLDLNVRVLTTGSWPIAVATQGIKIPAAPRGVFEAFRLFYMAQHSSRKLTLQPQLGSAEMNAFYGHDEPSVSTASPNLSSGPRTCTILVSTYQMCVMMLFNNRDGIPYEDIAHDTGIPEEELVHALLSLSAGGASERVLVKEPETNDVGTGDVFFVNQSFAPEFHKVKIPPVALQTRNKAERNEVVVGNVDAERRFEVDAAIVRVMKKHEELSYNELATELISLLRSRYVPSHQAIKKRIDALLRRGYIKTAPDDEEVYTYVP